jgi:hypothetical protein
LQVQVAEQTQDFYRRTDPAKTWSCNDYPSRLKKTLESYGSLSASPEDVTGTAGQPDYGTRNQQQQPPGNGESESGRWRSAAIDGSTTEQPDYGTQQQQHPFSVSASAAHTFEHSTDGLHEAVSSGEAAAAHHHADASAQTAEDPLMLVDWSNWGLQSLFPQDPVPMGNELFSDWFH